MTVRTSSKVLLADGTYSLNQYAVQITQPITVRGASGNRAAVRIQGQGYGVASEGFMIHSPGLTIADLTITAIRRGVNWIVRDKQIDNVWGDGLWPRAQHAVARPPASTPFDGLIRDPDSKP